MKRTLSELFRIPVCAMMIWASATAFPAQAQEPTAPTPQTHPMDFDIPAQPLGSALNTFAARTGWQVSVPTDLASGVTSTAVSGSHTPERALETMLTGTGLTYRVADQGAVTIERGFLPAPAVAPVATQSQIPTPANGAAMSKPNGRKPVKVPEILVKDVRERDDDSQSYIAAEASTATQTDTPLIETPRSISVVTTKQIETLKARGINEALRYTASVVAEPRGVDPNRSEIFIRGFRNEDTIYRDGLKGHGRGALSFAATTIDTYGAERVEVLRGPASVLYGQGLPSGLVNMVTKKPTDYAFGEIESNVGSYQQYVGRFDLGGPIDQDRKLLFRLTGLGRGGDTQFDFLDTGRVYIAPALTWRPSSATNITFLGQYQWDDSYATNFVPSSGTVLPNPNGRIPRSRFMGEPAFEQNETKYAALGYLLDHKVGESFLFNHKLRFENFNMDGKSLFNSGFQNNNRIMNRTALPTKEDGYFFSTNMNGQFKFKLGRTENTTLMGIDFKTAMISRNLLNQVGPSLDAFSPIYGQPVLSTAPVTFRLNTQERLSQVGVYFQHQTKLFDHLVATFGGRQDWADSDLEDRTTTIRTKQSHNAFTYQGGLLYLFDNGLAPYFNYATSFEPQSGRDFAGSAFVPLTGTQYEAGIKYQPPGYNSLVTMAVFDLTRQNVLTPDLVNIGFNVQTGEVRSRGIEIEGKANPLENLNILAAYTYTDPEVTKSNGTNLGKQVQQVPNHMTSLWADYTIPQGPLAGLGIGSGVRYVSASFGDVLNTFEVPSFVLLDAMLSYTVQAGYLKGLRFAINAHNLLDKSFIAACGAINSCYFGAGRDVRGSVTFRW